MMGIQEDKLKALLKRALLRVTRTDALWLGEISKRFGEEVAWEIRNKTTAPKVFGEWQAKDLKRLLKLGGGVDAIRQAFQHSHWAILEDVEIKKLSKSSLLFRTRNCSAQRMLLQRIGKEIECKPGSYLVLESFVKIIDPTARIECNFCPPDPHPEDVFCEWLVIIEG
ncbi:MAG: DUF6125 family protein [Candidatus Lokiarchaeia archaeon]